MLAMGSQQLLTLPWAGRERQSWVQAKGEMPMTKAVWQARTTSEIGLAHSPDGRSQEIIRRRYDVSHLLLTELKGQD